MVRRRHFTDSEIKYAKSAFDSGVSLNRIAERFNCDRKTIQRAILDNVFGRVGTDYLGLALGNGARASGDLLKARDERLAKPYRSLGDELMGCPRVGESALDRKLAGVGA